MKNMKKGLARSSEQAREANGLADSGAEMRRQMEAAKQRMQKYHAVYSAPSPAADEAAAVIRSPEQ
jgi:hypothetical protein